MKLQMTAITAAIALATSGLAMAQTVTSYTNLDYKSQGGQSQGGGYGVDNADTQKDDDAWTAAGFPRSRDSDFADFQNELNALPGSSATSDQNKSEITQNTSGSTTTGNEASVMQGGGSGNESKISQNQSGTGDALEADVVQVGNDNYSDIKQDLGTGGIVNVSQDSSQGAGHQSRVTQLGADNNGADIVQTGSGQKSIIYQGVEGGGAVNNNAWVNQSGAGNDSFILQQWHNNYASATQTGTDGISHIKQRGDSNIATLDQSGLENQSYILQGNGDGTGYSNEAYVTQSGDSNVSYASQLVGDDNLATVTQSGTKGESEIYQEGSLNEATITQSGDGDVSLVIQQGNGKTANVTQSGDGIAGEFNESFILQTGTGAHVATVTQDHTPADGWNNISTITQLGDVQGVATVNQTGNGNRASTIQY